MRSDASSPASRRCPRHLLTRWFVVLAAVLLLGITTSPASAAGTGQAGVLRADDAEQALAERFAPVVRLVHQDVECGPGEPYQPSDVELVLGDQSVALRGPWAEDDMIQAGPTAEDLERGPLRLPPGLPGQPARGGLRLRGVGPGRGRGLSADDVRPCGDRGRRGRPAGPAVLVLLPVQRLHQQARGRLGDDPARLRRRRRDAGARPDTARGRLQPARGPRGRPVGRPEARDRRRQPSRRATPPPARTPTTTTPRCYLGTSGEQGFGCDDTRGPADDVRPAVAVIPGDPAAARAEFPWIAFQGRWGQREEAFYNGPTGPNTKESWTHPISYQEQKGRDVSYAVPVGGLFGTSATDFFCSTVSGGSEVVRKLADHPGRLLADPGAARPARGLAAPPHHLDTGHAAAHRPTQGQRAGDPRRRDACTDRDGACSSGSGS